MIYRRVIFLDTMAAVAVLVAETVRKRYTAGRGGGRSRDTSKVGWGGGGGESGKRKGGFQAEKLALYTSYTTWKRMSAFLAAVVDSITPLHAQPPPPRIVEGWGGCVTAKEGVCSLISQPVNNKNIDITRPYIKLAVFGSFYV